MLAEKGDVLRISGIRYPVVVVSNNDFNQSNAVIVCPLFDEGDINAVHASVLVNQNQKQYPAIAICEDVRYVALRARQFSKMGTIDYFQMMDISDILIGLFEYN